ncbi:hypothetical protein GQ55_4G303900 [Panicum hallii var. hallii]|uniref:Uncharacterized protein n=1 Tax=Panicum hallii var. hallii TaxID=1504633 RepID=A0A2T7E1N2_9POAL|nr:hypothetical protein GQ55_4G303900 [Panicum hallii var. hallii]
MKGVCYISGTFFWMNSPTQLLRDFFFMNSPTQLLRVQQPAIYCRRRRSSSVCTIHGGSTPPPLQKLQHSRHDERIRGISCSTRNNKGYFRDPYRSENTSAVESKVLYDGPTEFDPDDDEDPTVAYAKKPYIYPPTIGKKPLSLAYGDIMNKVHYFESWSLDEFNKINRRQEDICEEIKEINVTLDTIQRTLLDIKCDTQPLMRMDEVGVRLQDCRVSKVLSSTAGRPPKPYGDKASKFYPVRH